MKSSMLSRRTVLAGLTTAASLPTVSGRSAAAQNPTTALQIAVRSPWMCNAIAATADGTLFVGVPRFAGHVDTPSLGRVAADGSVRPFPGGKWNAWQPGGDGHDAFVMVNAIHVFADGALWAVDQGSIPQSSSAPAPKLVRLDPKTGAILDVVRFGADILPPGSSMNDLRVHGDMIYVTDSGLGGIIVHDMATGRTLRRLSGNSALRQDMQAPLRGKGGRVLADAGGRRPGVQSDMIELDADGAWLYWSTPTGPVRRIPTALLRDGAVGEVPLAAAVRIVAAIPTIGGTAIDTRGNLYLSDVEHRRISVLSPQGAIETLAEDDRLVSPDAIFIDRDRRLLVPASQIEYIAPHHGGNDVTQAPWLVLEMPLPRALGRTVLGDAVDGRAATHI